MNFIETRMPEQRGSVPLPELQQEDDFPLYFRFDIPDRIAAGDVEELRRLLDKEFMEYHDRVMTSLETARMIFSFAMIIAFYSANQGGLSMETGRAMCMDYLKKLNRLDSIPAVRSFLPEMLLEFAREVRNLSGGARYSGAVRYCVAYISGHTGMKLAVSELAAACRLSPATLERRFRRETGMSVTGFIRREKIKKARYLLEYTDVPVIEIGQSLAFCSQSYFIRMFKAEAGISPAQYRKNCRLGV